MLSSSQENPFLPCDIYCGQKLYAVLKRKKSSQHSPPLFFEYIINHQEISKGHCTVYRHNPLGGAMIKEERLSLHTSVIKIKSCHSIIAFIRGRVNVQIVKGVTLTEREQLYF